nr:hypothetical protein [Tanacetum cinerariifolium]
MLETSTLGEIVSLKKSNKNVIGLKDVINLPVNVSLYNTNTGRNARTLDETRERWPKRANVDRNERRLTKTSAGMLKRAQACWPKRRHAGRNEACRQNHAKAGGNS